MADRVVPWRPGPAIAWAAWWRAQSPVGLTPDAEALARRQGFVLSSGQLRAFGVSRSAARHSVRIGRWFAPMRGFVAVVDIRTGEPTRYLIERRRHALAVAAACLTRPGHVASGRSAAILHGLPTLGLPPLPELTEAKSHSRGNRPGAHVYPATVAPREVGTWFGIESVTPARAVVDCARHDRRDGIMAADAALHDRLTTRAGLRAALETARQWPGVIRAREVVRLACPLAESPIESLLRMRLHDDGFPRPEPQFEVDGCWADLALVEHGLLLEADGREKYSDDALWDEKRREQVLRRPGWWVERVIMSEVLGGWPVASRRVRASMRPGFRPR